MKSVSDEIAAMIERGRHLVPAYMWGGVSRYMVNRIAPGSFLEALFSNDLMGAMGRADDVNADNIRQYCQFLYNYAPRGSYGSPDNVRAWLKSETVDA